MERRHRRPRRPWRPCAALAVLGAGVGAQAQTLMPDDPYCIKTPTAAACAPRPDVINGTPMPLGRQERLGLVTVGNRCSGTLLNRFWVLTADHCVTTNGLAGGPLDSLDNNAVTAAWSDRSVAPTRIVRWASRDIALMFLGAGDLGPVPARTLYAGPVLVGDPIATYGRGIANYAYVDANGVPRPTSGSGRYREAVLFVSATTADRYTMPVNALSQINGGGDSGGPAHLLSSLGASLGIVGVTSSCAIGARLPGQPDTPTWRWVTRIDECAHAAIDPIRPAIRTTIREGIEPCRRGTAGCGVPETTSLTVMLR